MEILRKINFYASLPLIGLVVLYQKTLSPDHSSFKKFHPHGFCKFYPSCSEYARVSLQKQGLLSLSQIIKRIIKCNPFSSPALDLP